MTDTLLLLATAALTVIAFVAINQKSASLAPVRVKVKPDQQPRRRR